MFWNSVLKHVNAWGGGWRSSGPNSVESLKEKRNWQFGRVPSLQQGVYRMSLWFLLACHCKNQENSSTWNAVITSSKICIGGFPCFRHISSMIVDAWDKMVDEIQSMLIKYFGEKRATQADQPSSFFKWSKCKQGYVVQRKLKSYNLPCLEKSRNALKDVSIGSWKMSKSSPGTKKIDAKHKMHVAWWVLGRWMEGASRRG